MSAKPIIVATILAGILIIGYFVYTSTQSEAPPAVSAPLDIPEPEPVAPPEPEPAPVPDPVIPVEPVEAVVTTPQEPEEPPFVLPLLDSSDQLIRDGVVSLTRHEGINRWLAPNELVRKFVVFVDNVANGQIAREPARALAPEGPFLVKPLSEDVFLLDEASYQRYDAVTSVLLSIDARRAAEFYDLLRPLVQEAFEELGYPDKKFEDEVFRAIGRLLETPVITEPIRLTQPVVMYEFEDAKLEGLSGAQKQMIRMGPKNTRALQAKLSEVALELRAVVENN
jgi:hypothetical protein